MTSKDKGASRGSNKFELMNSVAEGAMANRIVPPGPERDRSGPERERYKERQRGKLKGKAGDAISRVPIVTKGGTVKVPVPADKEPIFRPGRDGDGGGGQGDGEAGEGSADYVEMPMEEFVKWVLEELDLPNMEKKQLATTMVKSQKVKGISQHGPKARMNKRATTKARIKRVAALRNAQPGLFVDDFAQKCQQVFDVYYFYAVASDKSRPIFPEKVYDLIGKNIEAFLASIETIDPYPKLHGPRAVSFREEVRASVLAYLASHANKSAPYTVHEQLRQRIETYVYEKVRGGDKYLPSIEEVPFHEDDFRFNRLQDKYDPDSQAVVFFLLDRSGSMQGDPLSLCKMYFFLCVLFLRSRYKDVEIVLISHDGQDYLWKTEEEFFNIGAGGGTVVESSLKLIHDIAEFSATCAATKNSAGPFPRKVYNRFMFQGTDGDLFDGDAVIAGWWKKIVLDLEFSYCGYLECGTSWNGRSGWRGGGQALLTLPAEAKERIGMAKANKPDDVIKAFKEILTKNANTGGA
jgi:uncharacterized sporulation protein YeaH/YhbH (DUF444 family)